MFGLTSEELKRLIVLALRRARERSSLSIDEAAAKTGINQLTLENHERGRNLSSMEYFFVVLEAYGLDLVTFNLSFSNSKPRSEFSSFKSKSRRSKLA